MPFYKREVRAVEFRPMYIVLIASIAALIVVIVLLRRQQKKQERQRDEQQALIDEVKQTYSMLVIDKKKVPLKDADIPDYVKEETPRIARRSKVGLVKVKVGPKVMTMIADNDIFDLIPVKKEIKATVAGLYITDVRGIRTGLEKKPEKNGFFARMFGGFGGMMGR